MSRKGFSFNALAQAVEAAHKRIDGINTKLPPIPDYELPLLYSLQRSDNSSPEPLFERSTPRTYINRSGNEVSVGEDIPTFSHLGLNLGRVEDQSPPIRDIVIEPEFMVLKEGESGSFTYALIPGNTPDTDVTITSTDVEVATVSNETVTAVSEGTATIIVRSTVNSFVFAEMAVTVESAYVPVDSVEVEPSSATLEVGDTLQLDTTVLPADATDKRVIYSSNNTQRATVNGSGLIRAVSPGTVTIRARATTNNSILDTCFVTVAEEHPIIPVDSVEVEPSSAVLEVGDTLQLDTTVLPADATEQGVSYTSSISTVAVVNPSGRISALSPGTTTITCRSVTNANIFNTCFVAVQKGDYTLTIEQTSNNIFGFILDAGGDLQPRTISGYSTPITSLYLNARDNITYLGVPSYGGAPNAVKVTYSGHSYLMNKNGRNLYAITGDILNLEDNAGQTRLLDIEGVVSFPNHTFALEKLSIPSEDLFTNRGITIAMSLTSAANTCVFFKCGNIELKYDSLAGTLQIGTAQIKSSDITFDVPGTVIFTVASDGAVSLYQDSNKATGTLAGIELDAKGFIGWDGQDEGTHMDGTVKHFRVWHQILQEDNILSLLST